MTSKIIQMMYSDKGDLALLCEDGTIWLFNVDSRKIERIL